MGLNNISGVFSDITEDYSNYRWYKGENENPYEPYSLAAAFWEYEREFHFSYLDNAHTSKNLETAYNEWKNSLINDYLPSKAPNPYGDTTDWAKAYNTGLR